jgi:raffinose/stachyose/melibiose transport system permease protein
MFPTEARGRSAMRERGGWRLIASVVIGLWCLVTGVLLLNVLVSSFKTGAEILARPWALPARLVLKNYAELLRDGFMRYYGNSFVVLAASICGLLALAAPAAYGLGKFQFRGNRALRLFFLVGMMFPVQLGIIPLFGLMKGMGLINTVWSVVIIFMAGLSIPVFLLTNYMQSIPDVLREAARMDGASELRIFIRIFIPLMTPAFGALIPLTAVGIWNEFFIPLVFISNDAAKTLPLGLLRYFTGHGFNLSKLGVEFAAVAISIVPLILLYLAGSRRIIQGLTMGAVK